MPAAPPRIYFPGELRPGGRCQLPAAQTRHLARVLRLKPGDAVTVFNGDGAEYQAAVTGFPRGGALLAIGSRSPVERESPLEVVLAQAVSRGERMDYTLQKAVELGVAAIEPLATARTVVQLGAERAAARRAHWQAVVVAACEQCGRNRVPAVAPLARLEDWLARSAERADASKWLLSPRGVAGLRALGPPRRTLVLLAGPEGGLSPEEERAAAAAGFVAVRLGPRLLRTETAAVAALAAVQALWGDF